MISKKSPVTRFRKSMDRVTRKQMPFAAMLALTRTAWDIKKAEDLEMETNIDKPTPFTKKAVRVKGATKSHLVAYVSIAPLQARYLRYAIKGGTRKPSRRSIPLPIGQRVNKYGNMPRKAMGNLLASPKTFSGKARGRQTPGIYKRIGTKKNRKLKLMVSYQDHADYRKIWPFFETAEKTARKRLGDNMAAAQRKAMETRR